MSDFKHYANISDGTYFGEIQGDVPKGLQVVEVPSAPDVSGALWSGSKWAAPEPVAPSQQDYTNAIQAHLDATAQTRNYDTIHTAVAYVGVANPQFNAEAIALKAWLNDVWTHTLAVFEQVTNGEREQPSIEELIAELPEMVWPE